MMRRLSLIFFAVSMLLLARPAQAFLEFNGFYFSDGLTTTSSTTSSRMFIEGAIGFSIDHEGRYLVGWNYGLFTSSTATSTTTAYSSTQMGPRFVWFPTRSKSLSLGLAYNLVTKATYDNGAGTSAEWTGTALKADLGYNFNISDSVLLGLRLNYSSSTYTSQLIGATNYSTIGYAQTFIYPSIYTIWLW